jgi:hypothetical protein
MPRDVQSPKVQLRRTTPEDAEACGRIFHEAFSGINNRHGFPPEIPTVESAIAILTTLFSLGPKLIRMSSLSAATLNGR